MISEIPKSTFLLHCRLYKSCTALAALCLMSGYANGTIGLIRKRETKTIEQIFFFVLFCTRNIAAWSCKNYCKYRLSSVTRNEWEHYFCTMTAARMNVDKMCLLQLIYGYYRRPSIWAFWQGYVDRGLQEIKTPRTWQGGLRCSARAQDMR